MKDGLSSNAVSYAVKDDKGFLWIATNNGLNRFDGNAFDHFFNDPADSSTIASNEVNNLFIDHKRNLWVTTMAGLSLYHPVTQSFSNYSPDTLVLPAIGHLYPAITEDDDGNIWLGGWYDLLLFNPTTKTFRSSGWAKFAETVKPAAGNHSRVVVLAFQPKGNAEYWVLTTYGLFSVNKKTLQFTYYPYQGISDYYGCQLNYVHTDGSVWMGTFNHGILSYKPQTASWKRYSNPVQFRQDAAWDWAYGITQFSKDTLLYYSQKSLLFLTTQNGLVLNQLANVSIAGAGVGHNIMKAGSDFWLLSTSGITRMYPAKKIFNLITNTGLRRAAKIFPLNDPGKFISGNDSTRQILLCDATRQSLKHVTDENNKPLYGYLSSYKKVNDTLHLLASDDRLYRYLFQQNSVKPIELPGLRFANNPRWVRNMVTDYRQKVWIRLRRQGIVEYDLVSNSTRYLDICNAGEQTTFCSMYFDADKSELWVGVENKGIYIYNAISKTTRHLLLNIAPSQKGATISGFCGGAKGLVYGCDVNYGMFAFNTANTNYVRYSVRDGLANNNCNFICKDAAGNIWVSHTEGISRFDTLSKSFLNFPELKEAALYASFIQPDDLGNIYMPAADGFYQWSTESFTAALPVGVLYTRNVFTPEKSLPIQDSYQFSPGQHNLSFQFGYRLLENEAAGNDRVLLLQYQLNNGAWFTMNTDNTISFSNLAPNQYLLNVREKSNPGQVLSIRFSIQPPFYKTWWFILLTASLVAAIVGVIFYRRLNVIKRQAALKQQIAETEMMALRAQMNPHFIFNCISSIDNFILDNDKDNASRYLNKFAKLIRNILDNSRNDVIPFWKDWETIKLYIELEQLRSDGRFSYTLHADDALLNGHYKIPPLIIQPYIENAIHHGLNALTDKKGELLVEARLKNNVLEYLVSDNGIGRLKAGEKASISPSHQSYGLQLTRQRIGLYNNQENNNIAIDDRYDANGAPAGTMVKVVLKI